MTAPRAEGADALAPNEVRVYTIETGDRGRVRELTRAILARLTGTRPEAIVLDAAPGGKPTLRNDPGLHFSVSHTRDVALVAVTRVAPVGVDVERIRPVLHAAGVLRRLFGEAEAAAVMAAEDGESRFMRIWTRGEATVKVRGASVWDMATPDPSVTVAMLDVPGGYAAAVAVAARGWHVTRRTWSSS